MERKTMITKKDHLLHLTEAAIDRITEAITKEKTDQSWCRPKRLSPKEVQNSLEATYHYLRMIEEELKKD